MESDEITCAGELPPDVLQFIAEQVDTVPHLEALLLLYNQPTESWTAERTAARLYVSPEKAETILRDLEQRRLAKKRSAAPIEEYLYDPAWDGNGNLMAKVVMTYTQHLHPVATFIHAKAPRSVLEFARAFDLNKDR